MFCPSEEESQNKSRVSQKNNNRKRKKKSARKNQQHGVGRNKRKQGKLATTMSTWAENFTFAATWQLKHQLAYWKARAMALEYENGVLHEIIRKRNNVGTSVTTESSAQAESEPSTHVGSEPSTQIESDSDEEFEEEANDEDFEVSEEFIQFLQANAKYREDARRERERLKAQNLEEDVVHEMEAGPSESMENTEETLKELYGDSWRRISALEINLQSQFIHESDKSKPMYWPNIPFNFNFS